MWAWAWRCSTAFLDEAPWSAVRSDRSLPVSTLSRSATGSLWSSSPPFGIPARPQLGLHGGLTARCYNTWGHNRAAVVALPSPVSHHPQGLSLGNLQYITIWCITNLGWLPVPISRQLHKVLPIFFTILWNPNCVQPIVPNPKTYCTWDGCSLLKTREWRSCESWASSASGASLRLDFYEIMPLEPTSPVRSASLKVPLHTNLSWTL